MVRSPSASLTDSLSVSFRSPDGADVRSPADTSLSPLHTFDLANLSVSGLGHSAMVGCCCGCGGRPSYSDFAARLDNGGSATNDRGPVFAGPSLNDQVSFLSGIDNGGNVVAQSFWTWRGNTPATYASNSDASKWGADHATTNEVVTVDYFFQAQAGWNATEKGVWQSALSLWSAITNVQFNEVGSQGEADLILKRGNDGSAYEFDQVDGGNNAGEVGGSELWVKQGAVVSIDTSVPGFGPFNGSFTDFGGYVWGTVVHELGHALGLGHAGAYNGSVNTKTQQFSAYDTLLWSVMSYISPDEQAKYDDDYTFGTDWNGDTPTTWMPLDILAVQQLYGAPVTTPLNGGQTFGFNCDVGGEIQRFFDFTVNTDPTITIWSAGTGNTLDLSGFAADSDINLNPGTFTSADAKVSNIGIAFGTVIETAIGGKGNDNFLGTEIANTLVGNKGNDTFDGGLGADDMNGGKGSDVFAYALADQSTGAGFDTIVAFDFAGADRFDFGGAVSGVDNKVKSGAVSLATFDADMEAAVGAANLGADHAVLFKVSGGDFAGDVFLVVDGNGTAGYQSGQDFVLMLDGARHTSDFDIADFI